MVSYHRRAKLESSQSAKHLPLFISKMEKQGLPPVVIETFSLYYHKIITGETGLVCDGDISAVAPDEVADSEALSHYADAGKDALRHAVRIVLNGGLGTSMGLTGPKSLLEVKEGKTFLDMIVRQTEQANVRLALMNSFTTHEATLAALSRMDISLPPLTFLQHKFPKILQADFTPAIWPENPQLEWNPPGHGDIYTAMLTSGMLRKLLDEGIRYAFISNSDNLGASLETTLLGYFSQNAYPFMMEVAERTPADMKGGHLARQNSDGRLILREIAQRPEDELDAFKNIDHYGFFNTNNLWVNLEFLRELIEKEKTIRLPMILNPKTLDPRDEASPKVFQIETAMGAAISLFEGATAVRVPRTRFFPVKKCNELLAIRSDCFVFSETGTLVPNPDRKSDEISIQLDPKHYGKTDQFSQRFESIPSLIKCESLKVEGDVYFEKNVTIRGHVTIRNSQASPQAVVREGTTVSADLSF